MEEIVKNNVVLARHIVSEDIKNGLNFFSKDAEFIQVGAWGHYEKGKLLNRHIHNEFLRESTRTYEMLYIVSGAIEAEIYDINRELVDSIKVNQGEILILLESGHGYKTIEENTTVLEVKNGPYFGPEKDRVRF